MPFRAERYPANWNEIRFGILLRANNMCEQCRAPNRAYVVRGIEMDRDRYMLDTGDVFDARHGAYLCNGFESDFLGAPQATRIILTIAHLDHVETNNADTNLRALCQRCHLAHDREDNQRRARETREAKRGPILPGVRS